MVILCLQADNSYAAENLDGDNPTSLTWDNSDIASQTAANIKQAGVRTGEAALPASEHCLACRIAWGLHMRFVGGGTGAGCDSPPVCVHT
jgi:hypothetical protein